MFFICTGAVAQLARALPCHGRGCGFKPRRFRTSFLLQQSKLLLRNITLNPIISLSVYTGGSLVITEVQARAIARDEAESYRSMVEPKTGTVALIDGFYGVSVRGQIRGVLSEIIITINAETGEVVIVPTEQERAA